MMMTISEQLGYSPVAAPVNLERFVDTKTNFTFNILSPEGVAVFLTEDVEQQLTAYDFILSDSIEYADSYEFCEDGITFYTSEGRVFAPWTSVAYKNS